MRAQKSLTDDEKAQVLIRAGQFAAAVDGIAASLDSAYKANADGKTKPALSAQAGVSPRPPPTISRRSTRPPSCCAATTAPGSTSPA